jgi:hypothetical protein
MQLNLLDAIVRVRVELLLSNKCCKDFIASPEMLKKLHIRQGLCHMFHSFQWGG